MKRSVLPFALGLALTAAAIALHPAAAGEQPTPPPGPGLEIFDGAAPLPSVSGGEGTADLFADPYAEPAITQPPYQPPTLTRQPAPPPPETRREVDPYAQSQDPYAQPYMDPYADPYATPYTDPYATQPYTDPYGGDPFSGLDPAAPAPMPAPGFAPDPYATGAPAQQPPYADPYYVPDPIIPVTDNLNIRNPLFPGLDQAAAQQDLQGAASIIWDTLKKRRIVDSTMKRGVRGSVGASSPYEMQRVVETINQTATPGEDPLLTAQRINIILDAFEQPIVDDFTFGSYMPQILTRLNEDVQLIRYALPVSMDDGVYLEVARTVVRAATTCDFFSISRKQLIQDVRAIMSRGEGMFYPDGSSIGGDVAGITGNLFQIMLMIDRYSRNDSSFRRDVSSIWKVLERPSRYLLEVACPNLTLPNFGPRASRELTPTDVATIESMFPKPPPRVTRIGLAATQSFPPLSTTDSYGGVYATRDGTGGTGRYMAIRFGPWGSLWQVPTHNDFGSLVLTSRGIKYLVDAGDYGGASASGAAHSGLSLSGKYVEESTFTKPGEKTDALWRTNASFDYVTDMAGFADGKTWQRSLLYVKNLPGETRTDYWLVLDHVSMNNDPSPQQAIIRYQLAPGVQAYNDGSGILASAGMDGTGVRFFAVDAGANIQVVDGNWSDVPSQVFDASGGTLPSPSVTISRNLIGDSSTATVVYPVDAQDHRPRRIERDSDIIRGRTGAIVIDHGMERLDVIAWAPPGTELVTPTLNLQLSADMAVFRVRRGKIARIDFVNLKRFQAKEPDGGLWSMRVNGPAQTLTIEQEKGGGWQVLADPGNRGSADFFDVNFGPTVSRTKFSIRPGEMRVISR